MKKYFFAVPEFLVYETNCLVRICTNDINSQHMFGEMLWVDIEGNKFSCSSFISSFDFVNFTIGDLILGDSGGDLQSAINAFSSLNRTNTLKKELINIFECTSISDLLGVIKINRIYSENI